MSAQLSDRLSQRHEDVERYQGKTLSERIAPYLEEIASRATDTEAVRNLPAENMRHIVNAGFMRALAPKAVGGDEVDLSEFHDAVRTLTKACPSTGWVAGVLGIHPPAVPHFNPEVQKEIWAHGPDVVLGSSGSPLIKAKPTDGGIIVSGRNRWSSGCDYAEWILGPVNTIWVGPAGSRFFSGQGGAGAVWPAPHERATTRSGGKTDPALRVASQAAPLGVARRSFDAGQTALLAP